MSLIDLHHAEHLPTLFTVEVRPEPRRHGQAAGAPVALLDDDGLRIWTPILGPASVLLARLLLAEPGRRWHIGDVAGQLGIGTDYAQRVIRRLAQFGWLAATADRDGAVTYHVLAPAPSRQATWNGSTRNWPPATPASAVWSGARGDITPSR